ncbi:hypothetical protein D3C74_233930 [compost metagenome]
MIQIKNLMNGDSKIERIDVMNKRLKYLGLSWLSLAACLYLAILFLFVGLTDMNGHLLINGYSIEVESIKISFYGWVILCLITVLAFVAWFIETSKFRVQ